MGVYTFVCRSSGDEWTAKQLSGELEASATTPYELQRRLVVAASGADSASGVQTSFAMVTPKSAVFQVIVGAVCGGGGGGAFIGGGAPAGDAAAEAPAAEEEKEESDDDMGFSLFD